MNASRWKQAVAVMALAFLAACGESGPDSAAPGAAVSLATMARSSAASVQFEVTGLHKLGETRVGRSVFDVTYQVDIRNHGVAAAGVQAQLTAAPAGVTIIDGQVGAGNIGAGATVRPQDTVVLRIDRTVPFAPEGLAWNIVASAVRELAPVKPAEVVVLSLADLGFPEGADTVSVGGAVTEALLRDGTLRFATPGDTGAPQLAEFTLVKNGVSVVLSQPIQTERPTAPLAYVEPNEDGSEGPQLPRLSIAGLGPNNVFTGLPLKFTLEHGAPLDLAKDSDGLILGTDNTRVSLKPYWVFDPRDNSFSISGDRLTQFMAALPAGALEVSINFVSADGEFAAVYDLLALRQGAALNGKLVTTQGAPMTGLAGRKMLLRGFNQRLRLAAPVDASGNFAFANVIPDTYQLTLDDLEHPNVVSASTIVQQNATAANVTIVYNLDGAGNKSAARGALSSFVASSVRQDGTPVPRRALAEPARAASAAVALAEGTATFSAVAASQNATITTPISFDVPKGTSNVGVKITVSTAEYPQYTTAQSQYNDTWAYAVTGLPGEALSASGSVNQSHYTQGTISRSACIDVSARTVNGGFTVGGQVSATNIGDSALATVTTVELSTACAGLTVTEAKFTSPNKDGRPVLQPLNLQGNLPGPYLSVPLNGTDGTHTLPLEIRYAPADAEISEVSISISATGTPVFAAENLMGQTHTASNGTLKFTGVRLPAFAGANTNGRVAVTVRIKGKVDGTDATSDPQEGGQVAFNGATDFIPLYLANNEAGLGGRRYGTRDPGGDSWSTRQTIGWLQARAYRFDDTSGQHVTQTAAGRSILDHSGHSDGQQIDMRYADGQGGFTDTLGGQGNGAAIQQMINAARQEVVSDAAQKPRLAALQAWITANRNFISAEAGNAATRRIYIGQSFIKLALVDGQFSGSPALAIPGIQAWTKPAIVQPAASHLHHWHVSTRNHP